MFSVFNASEKVSRKPTKELSNDTLECRHKPGKKAINFESVTLRGSASQRQKGKN